MVMSLSNNNFGLVIVTAIVQFDDKDSRSSLP